MNAKKMAQSREAALQKYKPILDKHAELLEAAGTVDRKMAYNLLVKVGEGAYGEVYKARDVQTQKLCALKIIRVSNSVQADNGVRGRRMFASAGGVAAGAQTPLGDPLCFQK